MDVEQVIKQNTVSLVGKALMKRTNDLMTRNRWQVHFYYNVCSKKRKNDDMVLDLISYNEGDQIIIVNLVDNDWVANHFVAMVCDEYIFDSNFIRALP